MKKETIRSKSLSSSPRNRGETFLGCGYAKGIYPIRFKKWLGGRSRICKIRLTSVSRGARGKAWRHLEARWLFSASGFGQLGQARTPHAWRWGEKMKKLILIALLVLPVVSYASHDNEREMNKIRAGFVASLSENRTNTIAVLKQKIQSGTPLDKDAALYVVEDKSLLELVPCVIAAVTDKTKAPRYHDTGWTYIGRHAGWVVANLIRKLDSAWLRQEGYDKKLMDVCNDKDRGRLKSRWIKWWNQYQKKQKPQSG